MHGIGMEISGELIAGGEIGHGPVVPECDFDIGPLTALRTQLAALLTDLGGTLAVTRRAVPPPR